MAEAFGAVGSVVIGGCAIFATVALWALAVFRRCAASDRPDEAQNALTDGRYRGGE